MSNRDLTYVIIGLFIGFLLAKGSESSPSPTDVVKAAGSLVGPLASAL